MINNRIILGTAQFIEGYGINKSNLTNDKIENIITTAYQNGIRFIDTAFTYPEVHKKLKQNDIKKFNIISKIPKLLSNDKTKLFYELKSILERGLIELGTDKFHCILIHDLDNINDPYKSSIIMETLTKFKETKIINKIGLSIYSPKILEKFQCLDLIDVIQSPLNLIDQELINSGWLQRLNKKKIEVNIRSIFLQGLLLKKKNYLFKNYSTWKSIWNIWFMYLNEHKNIQPSRVCIDFIKNIEGLDKIIIGFNSHSELKEIQNIMKLKPLSIFPNIMSHDEKLIYPYNWSR